VHVPFASASRFIPWDMDINWFDSDSFPGKFFADLCQEFVEFVFADDGNAVYY